ncbi:hypothetical protein Sjap_007057 [Stephania japonica]|uniref:Uncharacterized protein n=1 Tax=Stephania japonica TaxID=461633 RepID=A0AAP0K8V4_9MAGN
MVKIDYEEDFEIDYHNLKEQFLKHPLTPIFVKFVQNPNKQYSREKYFAYIKK